MACFNLFLTLSLSLSATPPSAKKFFSPLVFPCSSAACKYCVIQEAAAGSCFTADANAGVSGGKRGGGSKEKPVRLVTRVTTSIRIDGGDASNQRLKWSSWLHHRKRLMGRSIRLFVYSRTWVCVVVCINVFFFGVVVTPLLLISSVAGDLTWEEKYSCCPASLLCCTPSPTTTTAPQKQQNKQWALKSKNVSL